MILELAMSPKARPGPWAHGRLNICTPIKATLTVRELFHELNPGRIASVALDKALRGFLNDFRVKLKASVVFHASTRPVRLLAVISTCLHRVTQECLTNVLKRAKAAHVSVTLNAQPDGVGLIVKDDRQRFVPEMVDGSHHLGLNSVGEGVRQVKGRITIKDRPGAGTAHCRKGSRLAPSRRPLPQGQPRQRKRPHAAETSCSDRLQQH